MTQKLRETPQEPPLNNDSSCDLPFSVPFCGYGYPSIYNILPRPYWTGLKSIRETTAMSSYRGALMSRNEVRTLSIIIPDIK